ncbi:hypothetical protein Bca52824_095112 [Brassica carinata]|uniref:Uncharacterized protein n=1 Tax=Brassica carinata TaxID=52824 RepID=A0A8X7TII8_BRACI|nr:hypothetical protein Bca52824_095527 [Brassica carinata]KAG2243044.1 hypothetical protein Bca52824_095112 [Brassica carinata]
MVEVTASEEEVELDSKNQSGFDAAVEGHCWELIRTLTRLVVTSKRHRSSTCRA